MSRQDPKTSPRDNPKWPGSSFPVFKVDVPMPRGTAPPRPNPPPSAASDKPKR
ncbi:hypothetical protein [uncultured Caulobacter sp.]|uniref:hypothetical protein n=1 Tax=uncultured Caulobacter sp. TaxID=158749 RepID=UPI002606FCD9|nr:hypothetical protein [uncultured Caulobacter sp.]